MSQILVAVVNYFNNYIANYRSQSVHVNLSISYFSKQIQTLYIMFYLFQMPEYENVALETGGRSRYTFQRSVSEPKPISKSHHSQVLHR